ncbi:MAG: protein phosphatase 2C domain-containing protein [Hyphomicrobiaceae bacterium]
MMRLELAHEAYIGARDEQQDSAGIQIIDESKHAAILVLADGLGGHKGGAEASKIVVQTFLDAAKQGAFTDPAHRHRALRDGIEVANTSIAGGVDPAHGHRSMASTAVIAIVAEGAVSWISVGDSHLYVWRKGALTKLNEDHSQAGLMVRSGQYNETDPEVLAAKSVLVSALTGRKLEIVDHPQQAYPLDAGDVLILASDGLNTISEDDIAGIVSNGAKLNAKQLSTALIEAVKERRADRQDNTTVAVARVIVAPKHAATEAPTAIAPRQRQEITTPTEVATAHQRTQIPAAAKPSAPAKASPGAVAAQDAPTQRVTPSGPVVASATQRSAAPTSATVPAGNTARTALPSAEARTAAADATARAASELRPDKPMAPIPGPPPARSGLLPLGLLMLALATLFGGLFIGRMLGLWDPLSAFFAPAPTTQVPTKTKGTPLPETAPAPPAKTQLPPPKADVPAAQPTPQPAPPQAPPTAAPPPRPEAPRAAPPPPPPPTVPAQPLPPQPRPETAPPTSPRADPPEDPSKGQRVQPPSETPPRSENQPSQTPSPPPPRLIAPQPRPAEPPPGPPARAVPQDRSGAIPAPRPGAEPRPRADQERERLEQERREADPRRVQQPAPERQVDSLRRQPAVSCNPWSDGTRLPSRNACFQECNLVTRPGTMDQQDCRLWCNDNCPGSGL